MFVKNKTVLVIGMGSSGVAAAQLLINFNNCVYVYDSRSKGEITEITDEMYLKYQGVFFGVEPNELINSGLIELVVISPGVALDICIVNEVQKAGIPIIGELELGYLFAKGRFLAITGTNGKTTTTSLVGKICECENIEYDVVGNIGKPVTQGVLEQTKEKIWVTEVSSFQLETINEFHPCVAAILNITPDHLNRHLTMDNYIQIKKRIYENQIPSDTLVINSEDEILKHVIDKEAMYFGQKPNGDKCVYLKEKMIIIRDKSYSSKVSGEVKIIRIDELRIIGAHNVQNAMAATAICYSAGISIESIKKGLREFEAVDHRLQKIVEFNGVDFYNDSKATNPDSAIKALQAIKTPIVLIAGGMDKKSDFTEFLQWVVKKAKIMIVFGQTSQILKSVADECGYSGIIMVEDMKSAVEKSFGCAQKGDTVLLSPACASWDMYANYKVRGEDFKNCVMEIGSGR